ncbi:hypothetical protein WN982_33170 [Paraburkholderia sp. IMGN_8]|uniref:hypothetical protein n=1 Tax=Paraburkholderia sp. IMGN_8 TaxID=3136564 RepID=UPI00310113F2
MCFATPEHPPLAHHFFRLSRELRPGVLLSHFKQSDDLIQHTELVPIGFDYFSISTVRLTVRLSFADFSMRGACRLSRKRAESTSFSRGATPRKQDYTSAA